MRLFVVQSGITLALQRLSLVDGLATGTNGNTAQPGGLGEGGAIYNAGGIVLANDCAFLRNQAHGGIGGMSAQFVAPGTGGAGRGGFAFNKAGGVINISNCVFSLNAAIGGTAGTGIGSASGGNASAGVIYNEGASLYMSDGLVLSNRVASGEGRRNGAPAGSGFAYGGAIFNN